MATRIRNEYTAELLAAEKQPDGSYVINDWPMTTSISREGMEMFAQSHRIIEELRPVLEMWVEHYADERCIHGVRFDDDSFNWSVNDYAFDLMFEPERAVLIFDGGFHGKDYCIAAWFDRQLGCFQPDYGWARAFQTDGRT